MSTSTPTAPATTFANEGLDPLRFTPNEVLRRLERHGDLFAPVLEGTQRLDEALARLA